jgi:hypothetical protein
MTTEPKMQPWRVETDKRRLRRLGKTGEELAELSAVVSRCIIQGVDEIDPSSGKTNRQRLQEEVADVYCQLDLLVTALNLNTFQIDVRSAKKAGQMAEWEDAVKGEA